MFSRLSMGLYCGIKTWRFLVDKFLTESCSIAYTLNLKAYEL